MPLQDNIKRLETQLRRGDTTVLASLCRAWLRHNIRFNAELLECSKTQIYQHKRKGTLYLVEREEIPKRYSKCITSLQAPEAVELLQEAWSHGFDEMATSRGLKVSYRPCPEGFGEKLSAEKFEEFLRVLIGDRADFFTRVSKALSQSRKRYGVPRIPWQVALEWSARDDVEIEEARRWIVMEICSPEQLDELGALRANPEAYLHTQKRWSKAKITDIDEALAWGELGIRPEDITTLKKRGVPTPKDAIPWFDAGIRPFKLIRWLLSEVPLQTARCLISADLGISSLKVSMKGLIAARHVRKISSNHPLILAGFNKRDVLYWLRAGVDDPKILERWRGFSAKNASTLYSHGIQSPEEIEHWKKLSFKEEEITDWISHGVTSPEEVKRWSDNRFSSDHTQKLLKAGVSQKLVEQFRGAGWYFIGYMIDLFSAGINSQESIDAWRSTNIGLSDILTLCPLLGDEPLLAKRWMEYFSCSNECKRWIEAGISDPKVTSRWRAIDYSAWDTERGCSKGLTIEIAEKWHALGFSPDDTISLYRTFGDDDALVSAWMDLSDSPDEIISLHHLFNGDQALASDWMTFAGSFKECENWRQAHVDSIKTAKRWLALGFSAEDVNRSNYTFTLEKAEVWRARYNPKNTIILQRIFDDDYESAKNWMAFTRSSKHCANWHRVDVTSIEEAKRWLALGYQLNEDSDSNYIRNLPIEVAEAWSTQEFSLKDAASLYEMFGDDPHFARSWMDFAGSIQNCKYWSDAKVTTQEDAKRWMALGHLPCDMPELVQQKFTLEIAEAWEQLGFQSEFAQREHKKGLRPSDYS